MQYPFSCTPEAYAGIERSLSKARISRYLKAAEGDRNLALRYYIWNARICEAFYLPMQLAEVTIRNAIYRAVASRYGDGWEAQGRFLTTLPRRLHDELQSTIRKEKSNHGAALTADHIVAGLSFGFWTHLLTKNYDHLLWKGGVRHAVPFAPVDLTRQKLHEAVEQLRAWRNRIAHHYAVFDKRPTSEYQHLLHVVGWIDPHTEWLIIQLSHVSETIGRRPRI